MNQAWLFGTEAQGPSLGARAGQDGGVLAVRFQPDFASWQALARRFLREQIAPARLWWQPDAAVPADRPASSGRTDGQEGIRVPRAFLDKARLVACHRNGDQWDLLYQTLWRIARQERHLLELHGDPQVLKLNQYAREVARDVHKMKAFVRFRAVFDDDAGEVDGSSDGHGNGAAQAVGRADPRYVAWFEPEHLIVEHVSGFFRRRFGGMRWSILTPDRCAHWEGEGQASGEGSEECFEEEFEEGSTAQVRAPRGAGQQVTGVWFTPGVDRDEAPAEDAFEDAWRLYYRSIFNPARLKVRAMLSEMPQKYWKNLPEARLIPSLVQAAHLRSAVMQANIKPRDEPRCGPRPPLPQEAAAKRLAEAGQGTLEQVRLQASGCRRCPLWEPATQTVWGEGPSDARIMLLGEQPGDQEDLAGRPFVGPAGRLLDRALTQAGLDRRTLYLTNTVKHFKFKSRGKRRLHDKPLDAEVLACLPWVQEEIARVGPALVVCLGATAARSQLGRAVRINEERGRLLDGNPRLLLTYHPSYLLRLTDANAAADAFDKLVADLRLARRVGLAWKAAGTPVTA
jgi:DNA polymerase